MLQLKFHLGFTFESKLVLIVFKSDKIILQDIKNLYNETGYN